MKEICSSPFYLKQKRKKAEDYALSLCHGTVCCLSYICTHETDVTNRACGKSRSQRQEQGILIKALCTHMIAGQCGWHTTRQQEPIEARKLRGCAQSLLKMKSNININSTQNQLL